MESQRLVRRLERNIGAMLLCFNGQKDYGHGQRVEVGVSGCCSFEFEAPRLFARGSSVGVGNQVAPPPMRSKLPECSARLPSVPQYLTHCLVN